MEVKKLQQEKAELEMRLRDVIQDEINRFVAKGGIVPAWIDTDFVRVDQLGHPLPGYVLNRVQVGFGL